MMRWIRVVSVALYTLFGGLAIVLAVAADRRDRVPPHGLGRWAQRQWCRGLCRLLGVTVSVEGKPLAGPPALLVANHLSWLDIVCIAARWPVAFLSKTEVRRWPVIGQAATALGTLYIDRGRPAAAAEAVTAMRRRLEAGGYVLFFPEGTTGDGRRVRPFRARLYQAAVDAAAPVQAIALEYRHRDGSTVASFTGDESLVANVWRLAACPQIEARLAVGAPRRNHERGRSELARLTRADVVRALEISETESEEAATANA
ncbi:lysophospholipid acyltransferase family protein [Arhodomonas sp. SL1]|uniref:lysophospholipid acyltransferase family protein n=1 Tax=Arhodomonas sp. SL1 TaxID=3425691 RepID=UPI003F880527